MAVELTVVIVCRDEAHAEEIMDVLEDEYDVIESETEDVG